MLFEEYIGRILKNRHKAIGLKYAKSHRFPELISPTSYGICFKDEGSGDERKYLVFRVYYDSRTVYDGRGRVVPGRSIKTITEVVLFGEGYDSAEMERAEQIARGYLEMATE